MARSERRVRLESRRRGARLQRSFQATWRASGGLAPPTRQPQQSQRELRARAPRVAEERAAYASGAFEEIIAADSLAQMTLAAFVESRGEALGALAERLQFSPARLHALELGASDASEERAERSAVALALLAEALQAPMAEVVAALGSPADTPEGGRAGAAGMTVGQRAAAGLVPCLRALIGLAPSLDEDERRRWLQALAPRR